MKLKTVIILLCIAFGSLLLMMRYYRLDYSLLSDLSFYQNLANPSIRIVRISEGLRKEEIADVMGKKLGWSEWEKNEFINIHLALGTKNLEGRYFPQTYMIPRNEDPSGAAAAMFHAFSQVTEKVVKPKSAQIFNQDTVLKVASIIQREAAGKRDMKLISGIIWNRIFKDMRLQVDATLQYAKGSEEDGWWTDVEPKDKKINSPYNTYLHSDLPPSPIANPGLAAIDAAWNPQKTSCLFYLHDKKKNIHCSSTYEGHKRNIDTYY